MFVVRDLQGSLVGYLEGDRLQDANGKPVGLRTTSDKNALSLSALAAERMAGRRVLLDLGPGDVVTPTTAFTVGIPKRPDYVADRVSPVRLVPHDRGTFFAENASDAIKLVPPGASAGGEPEIIEPGFISTSFTTVGYAVAAKMPRTLLSNADFDLRKLTLRRLVNALRLAREYRLWTLLTTSANWPTANKVVVAAGNKWNGGTTANPLADMMTALLDSYLPANVMVMPENVSQNFYVQPQASTGIRDYVQGGGEMPEVLYARGKILTGGAQSYIWAPTNPANVAVVRVASDPEEIGTTITCRWLGESPDGQRVEGMLVREYEVSSEDSTYLVVAHNDAEVFLSNQVGALIVGAQQ